MTKTFLIWNIFIVMNTIHGFSTTRTNGLMSRNTKTISRTTSLGAIPKKQQQQSTAENNNISSWMASVALITALTTSSLATTTTTAYAYEPVSDYASETVQEALQSLKSSKGNIDATLKAYENVAEIISEGKGIGGMINYQGIELERGYIADEDTSLYNPGLTLLTEGEKDKLVRAIIDSRKEGSQLKDWYKEDQNMEVAYQELREKLDPLHMVELEGYLKIVPFFGGILYLGVLAIQQNFRDLFPVAYIAGAAAFFVPIIGLILAGP